MAISLFDQWKRLPTPVQQVLRRSARLYQTVPNKDFLMRIFAIKELIIPYETYNFINFDLLRHFEQLQTLSITNNNGYPAIKFADLSGLSHLKQLKQLVLHYFSFNTLSGIEELNKLTYLDITSCKIEHPQAIGALANLTHLIYNNDYSTDRGNNSFDIGFIKTLTNLVLLKIHTQGTLSFAPLSSLAQLKYLDLSFYNNYYQQHDYGALSALISLQQLDLSNSWIKDIHFLRSLNRLTHLNLGANQINDCSPIAALNELIYLDLYNYYGQGEEKRAKLKDISPLQACNKLRHLHLGQQDIEDISPLNRLTKLSELFIDNNLVKDISPLAQCSELKKLNISNNAITDLSPLATLNNLTELSLIQTYVKDLTPLLALPNLMEINIHNTPITSRALNSFRNARPDCVIHH